MRRNQTLHLPVIAFAAAVVACGPKDRLIFDPGTSEDRAQLFDYILAKTLERESFSPIKNQRLDVDVEAATRRYRDELIAADTEEKLFYALEKISNARKDRHLRISLVDGGLRLYDPAGGQQSNYPVTGSVIPHVPVRLAVDYGSPGAYSVFVAAVAENLSELAPDVVVPASGDQLLAVNGIRLADYVHRIEPYHRYSTINGFWWQLATWLPQRSPQFPPEFYQDELSLELERPTGETYSVRMPYATPDVNGRQRPVDGRVFAPEGRSIGGLRIVLRLPRQFAALPGRQHLDEQIGSQHRQLFVQRTGCILLVDG